MVTQGRLDFGAQDRRLPVAEAPRLSRQCRAILERLRRGTATNSELSTISLKYTSRISELREAGYNVRVVERDHVTGRVVYRLVE